MYPPGLTLRPPADATQVDSVMTRFAKQGTPVIHLVEVRQLAAAGGLPTSAAELARVQRTSAYDTRHYNRWLAAGLLVLLLVTLYGFVLSPHGQTIIRRCRHWLGGRPSSDTNRGTVELMV